MEYVICHYHEIGLKGKNRRFFEEKLVENIKRSLNPADFEFVKRISGRILVKLTQKGKENENEIKESLKNIFGIAYFALAINTEQNIEAVKKKAFELLKNKNFKTFKISTQRSKKEFPLTSQQINERVGEYILKKLKVKSQKSRLRQGFGGQAKIKVDLENPDVTCFIEIVDPPPLGKTSIYRYRDVKKGPDVGQRITMAHKVVGGAFLYLEKIKGPGGLPVTVSGKVVALLSGGIDSPVAAFCVMKRGVKIIFLHFHAHPYTSKAAIEKVQRIVESLNKFQFGSRLYLIPFADIQKEILLKTSPKLRVVLYRRFMFRIAQEIAEKEGAGAIITGESIGQVASQTLENIKVIEEAAKLPVLRPLIGEDKEEIINKAKKIGTFNISILPHQDCCARFLPVHPETKAKLREVEIAEKKLNIKKLITAAINKTTIQKI